MDAFLEEFQHLEIQFEAIKLATRNFDKSNIIGKGGFGLVYVGVLCHPKGKRRVAFKRLDRSYGQGDPEFWKEILMLSRYTNENLISLLGFCDKDGERIVVYEHASHGSLDRHLSSPTLTWKRRLKICLAAAKGLSYLHDPNETQQRVLHRDIKSSNILLDDNWNAKVSDMGLSKIGPANQKHTFVVSNVVGTLGYIDPMYMQTCILTKESDVYSFGVVLFEVLCGRLCYENKNGRIWTLASSWKKSYKQKKLDEIVIQDLKQHMDSTSLETFSDIAYQCLKKSREKRPEMYQVVEKLEMALRFQEILEDVEPNLEEISKSAVPSLEKKTKEELKMLLSKGIFVNEGKTHPHYPADFVEEAMPTMLTTYSQVFHITTIKALIDGSPGLEIPTITPESLSPSRDPLIPELRLENGFVIVLASRRITYLRFFESFRTLGRIMTRFIASVTNNF
ncbi:hypothetical protein LXL04_015627 [Taraxacum kok-saghyz]